MYPWSVVATAGMPIREASANRSSIRAAPSSIEYSVCTCRCTKESLPDDGPDDTRRLLARMAEHDVPAHRTR